MMTRIIKPGFFRNESMSELPVMTKLLYVGLWCMADKESRLEDNPQQIKTTVFPFDDCDVDALLDDLQGAGLILRIEAKNGRIIQFCANRKEMLS